MGLLNLKKASNIEVENWLLKKIPNLTKEQMRFIRDDEIIRFSPYRFYKRGKKTKNVFVRLSIIFIPFVFIVLAIGLPFNYFITGYWGYDDNKINWLTNWLSSCGIM